MLALVVQRRGQQQFREALIAAYGSECAVTAADAVDALEAVYIVPYHGESSNVVQNGLLLRADIHTLFDLGLLSIDSSNVTILLAPRLRITSYKRLEGRRLLLPDNETKWPSKAALDNHRTASQIEV